MNLFVPLDPFTVALSLAVLGCGVALAVMWWREDEQIRNDAQFDLAQELPALLDSPSAASTSFQPSGDAPAPMLRPGSGRSISAAAT